MLLYSWQILLRIFHRNNNKVSRLFSVSGAELVSHCYVADDVV